MTEEEKRNVDVIAGRTDEMLRKVLAKKYKPTDQDVAMIANDNLFLIGLVRKYGKVPNEVVESRPQK